MIRYVDHPGYETDLMLVALDGRVVRRDGYWLARRPRTPDHIWGNLLVLDEAPAPADAGRWIARFHAEFGRDTGHVAFGWLTAPPDVDAARPFLTRGFDPVEAITLTATAPRVDPRAATGLTVRPLRSNSDWRAAAAVTRQMHDGRPDPTLDAWLERQVRRHRALTDAGHGAYFGAFLGATLAGCLGLYVRPEDGLARYQLVVTDRRLRRRGVARRLVAEAGLYALAHLGARTLVIVAEPRGPAVSLYRDAGFDAPLPTLGVMRRKRAALPPVALK